MFDFYSSYPCPAVITPFRKTPSTSRGAGGPSLSAGTGGILQLPPRRQPHRFLTGDVTGSGGVGGRGPRRGGMRAASQRRH